MEKYCLFSTVCLKMTDIEWWKNIDFLHCCVWKWQISGDGKLIWWKSVDSVSRPLEWKTSRTAQQLVGGRQNPHQTIFVLLSFGLGIRKWGKFRSVSNYGTVECRDGFIKDGHWLSTRQGAIRRVWHGFGNVKVNIVATVIVIVIVIATVIVIVIVIVAGIVAGMVWRIAGVDRHVVQAQPIVNHSLQLN